MMSEKMLRTCPACEELEEEGKPHDMQCLYERAVMQINDLHERWHKLRTWLCEEQNKKVQWTDPTAALEMMKKLEEEYP